MKVLLSWIREFVDVPATAEEIGARMSLRGLALEGLETHGDDAVLDFDVTANRPDCLSIRGIAREIATAYALPFRQGGAKSSPSTTSWTGGAKAPPSKEAPFPIAIADPDLCSRYVGAVADVTVGPSPDWMRRRLEACGLRPISNIVDVTNYVLLERGYPMHAFDYAKLAGPEIIVRRARAGEKIRTLDGKDRTLDPEMLVIADAERAQAIGGVMGGADSEVTDSTSRVVFEAAWFNPKSVRATSKRLGLRTEASYRFERGADLTATNDAMVRAVGLLEAIGAGRAVGEVIDCYPVPYTERELTLSAAFVRRILGMDVPEGDAVRVLKSLGFELRTLGGWQVAAPEASTPLAQPGHAWQVRVPGWRVDVHRPVDLVEEVGRHHGFEHLPSTFPAVEQAPLASDPRIARDARIRRALLSMGLSEAITFAFIDSAGAAPYLGDHAPVALANPLSEKFTTLRPSLLPGLVDALSRNRRHGRSSVRLFEIGTRFSPRGETRAAAAAWTGAATPEHWSAKPRDVDFFDIKGIAEQLCATMTVRGEVVAAEVPYLTPGRTAELRVEGATVGVLGQLDAAIAEQRDLPAGDAVYVIEIDLDALAANAPTGVQFARPLPRHPAVIRDIAVLLDDTLSADAVRGTIRSAGPDTLVDVREFDRYHGTGITEGKVSLALRLTFQAPDRTLTDAEVHGAMERIVAELRTRLGAVQR